MNETDVMNLSKEIKWKINRKVLKCTNISEGVREIYEK